jgi:eukaryotic-like serine/threonine-protein kinase
MECPACGRHALESSRYCPACGARVDGSRTPTRTVPAVYGAPPSDALDGAQFIPGTMLAGRYRIVGLLGRGGMGEVYRAEDLKLGQAVALKFLSKGVTHRADRLARFHQEVRLAREVSHPNVCRVHDISEVNGQPFLSMEYIDGEDLASLLRRIGRLPSDKALELARQLCAGLAAAHGRKVLHRDLKPANVLIDGRGRAHLVDFGLADLTDRRPDASEIAGTPGYMAPEQQEGREATTRTDVYALGLVLYEMFTGKRALAVDGAVFGGPAKDSAPPASPSTHVRDLDPAIERVIMRCLEHDPARRPSSALAVAAGLPGGNPLAAALAAGETPSPDMVAAAGEAGTLSPAIGAVCFAGVLIGLAVLAPLGREVSLIGLTNIELTPQQLTERAHTVLRNLGYAAPPADEAIGYATDIDYLQHIDEQDRSSARWRPLATAQPPALVFWYRRSPRRLVPIGGANIVTQLNPPPTRSGMASLTLDRTGRLVSLLAVPVEMDTPQQAADASAAAPASDWTSLLAEAGLPIAQLAPLKARWVPPIFADTRAAWEGAFPDRPDVPIRIEAAAAMGRPVYFDILAPWTRPRNQDPQQGNTSGERIGLLMRTVVGPLAFVVAVMLALRNLRLGRGDHRGAMRLAAFLFAAGAVSNALETGDSLVLSRGPSLLFFVPAFVWLLYIALEPDIRRVWPELMIGWSRLLAGGVRDPLVGRDVLVGVLVAIGDGLILSLHTLLRRWLGQPSQFPVGASGSPFDGMAASSDLLLGGRYALSRLIGSVMSIPVWSGTMLTFLLLLALYVLLRRRALAMAALILGFTVAHIVTRGAWLLAYAPADYFAPSATDVAVFAAVETAIVLVVVRFGLLTMLIASFVSSLLTVLPIAIDSSVPYASSSRLIVATVIALAAYGWYTALAGQPMFNALFPRDLPHRHA